MKIDLKNSKQIVIDLANAWDEIVVTPEKQKIQTDTREQTQKLRETVDKDSFFGGNIIFEYGTIGVTTALATEKIIDIRKTNQAAKE